MGILLLVRIALATMFALTALGAATAQASPTPEQGLADLNAWRAEAGEAPVASFKPEWNEGCRLHNEYEAQNGNTLTHLEEPGNPGFTPAGFAAGLSSVIASAELLPKEAWSDFVYHREQILAPRLRVSGYSASNGFTCLRTAGEFDNSPSGRTAQFTAYPWPPNGATDVRLPFGGGETPDPYELAPGAQQLGYLLSVDFNGPWETESSLAQSQISTASLVPDGGAAVPIAIDDANTGYSAGHGSPFAIFPKQPLARCTWYTAAAVGTAYPNGEMGVTYPIDVSWRFKTVCSEDRESLYGTPGLSFAKVRVKGHRLTVRLRLTPSGYPFDGVSLVARQGRKRRHLKLSEGLVAKARLASGRWALLARAAEDRQGKRVWFLTNTRRIRVP
jgi:hypothetical protein